jgi:hypothetical protein
MFPRQRVACLMRRQVGAVGGWSRLLSTTFGTIWANTPIPGCSCGNEAGSMGDVRRATKISDTSASSDVRPSSSRERLASTSRSRDTLSNAVHAVSMRRVQPAATGNAEHAVASVSRPPIPVGSRPGPSLRAASHQRNFCELRMAGRVAGSGEWLALEHRPR